MTKPGSGVAISVVSASCGPDLLLTVDDSHRPPDKSHSPKREILPGRRRKMWAAALSIAWISYVFANYTTQPPCCRDHLGTPACGRLLKSNPRLFARRCNTEAEFRLIQCCSTCNKSGLAMAYDLIARSLVDEQCFDRYGKSFCSRYINATDVFEPQKRWTCDGENPQIAFRTCRKSCGFCDFNIVSYRLETALKACKNNTITWRQRWGMHLHSANDRFF